MKHLPNALSLSRVPIGAAVGFLGATGYWLAALILLVVGAITDFADGEIARRYQLSSARGANVYEPVGDLALTAGAIAGLLFSGRLSPWTVVVAAVVYAAAMVRANRGSGVWRRRAETLLPFYYLAVLYALLTGYGYLALEPTGFIVYLALMVGLTVELAHFKRERIKDWL